MPAFVLPTQGICERSLFRENDLCCINELRDPDLKETILGKKKKKKNICVYVYVHAITN